MLASVACFASICCSLECSGLSLSFSTPTLFFTSRSRDLSGCHDVITLWSESVLISPQIFLATKFGITSDEKGDRVYRNEPEYVREAVETSLKRLQTDYIDLYYCHRFSGKVPVEDTIAAMAELVKLAYPLPVKGSHCSRC